MPPYKGLEETQKRNTSAGESTATHLGCQCSPVRLGVCGRRQQGWVEPAVGIEDGTSSGDRVGRKEKTETQIVDVGKEPKE